MSSNNNNKLVTKNTGWKSLYSNNDKLINAVVSNESSTPKNTGWKSSYGNNDKLIGEITNGTGWKSSYGNNDKLINAVVSNESTTPKNTGWKSSNSEVDKDKIIGIVESNKATLSKKHDSTTANTDKAFIKKGTDTSLKDAIITNTTSSTGLGVSSSNISSTTSSAINQERIIEACNKIKETATRLNEISKKINAAGDYCTPNEFSIKGHSYTENFDECCNCFQYASKELDEYADSIINSLNKALNNQQDEQYEKKRTSNNNSSNNNSNNNNDNNKSGNGKIDINNLPDEETLKKLIESGQVDQNTMKELEKLGKLPAPPNK